MYEYTWNRVLDGLPPTLDVHYIYLKGSAEALLKRVVLRGRECEDGVSTSYLRALGELHDKWLSTTMQPVALIDTERGPEGVYAEACTIIAEWIQSATFSADIAGCTAARTSVCANPDVADPSWWDTTLTR